MRHKENEPCSFVDVAPLDVKSHRTLGIEAQMVRVSPIGGDWLPLHDPVVILPRKTSDELHSERVDCPRICQSRQRSNSCAVVLERGHNPLLFGFSRRPHARTLSATHSCQPGDLLSRTLEARGFNTTTSSSAVSLQSMARCWCFHAVSTAGAETIWRGHCHDNGRCAESWRGRTLF
jgi:hypothetical protein